MLECIIYDKIELTIKRARHASQTAVIPSWDDLVSVFQCVVSSVGCQLGYLARIPVYGHLLRGDILS